MYEIKQELNPSPNDIAILGRHIMDYAKQQRGFEHIDFFAFFIRDDNSTILGGCNGSTLYGCLYIDQLWVTESLRSHGYGSKLVLAAEAFGRQHECTFATVNTMSWEAINFYKKLGYYVEFERHGFLKDAVFYFLRKELLA